MTLLRRIGRARIPILLVSAIFVLCGCDIVGPLLGMSPEAVAGDDQTVAIGAEVTLDGGSSVGQQLRFAWSLSSKPFGSTATISGSSSEIARMTPDLAGAYTVTLKVSNTYGDDTDTVLITATGGGGGGTIVLPGKPANIAASNQTTSSLTISWAAATNATKYFVYSDSTSAGGFATFVGETAGTSIVHSGLQAGTSYFYKVKAQNANGGTFSDAAGPFATLAAISYNPPANLRVAGTPTAASISLAWDPIAAASGYQLYRRAASQASFPTSPVYSGTGSAFVDTGLSASSSYIYAVRASYQSGTAWSALSGTLTALTGAAPTVPAAPTGVYVGNPTSSALTVFWTGSAGAAGYRIYRFEAGIYVQRSEIQSPSATSYTDSNLLSQTTYFYQVEAYNAAGPSALRGTASGATTAAGVTAPDKPAITSVAADSEDALVVAWTGGANTEAFDLQRLGAANQWETIAAGLPLSQTSYTDVGLDPATTYSYQLIAIRVVNGSQIKSAPSDTVSGTTEAAAQIPGQPFGPTPADGATGLTAESVAFSWSAPANPDGDLALKYQLYIGVDGAAPVLAGPNLASTAWSPPEDTILAGKTYSWYVVVADSQNHANVSPTWTFETAEITFAPPTVDAWLSTAGILRAGLTNVAFEGNWLPGDGTVSSKSWQIKARPAESTCTLTVSFDNVNRTTTATFIPDLVGAYTVAFTVLDTNALSASKWIYDVEVVAADASGAYFFIH